MNRMQLVFASLVAAVPAGVLLTLLILVLMNVGFVIPVLLGPALAGASIAALLPLVMLVAPAGFLGVVTADKKSPKGASGSDLKSSNSGLISAEEAVSAEEFDEVDVADDVEENVDTEFTDDEGSSADVEDAATSEFEVGNDFEELDSDDVVSGSSSADLSLAESDEDFFLEDDEPAPPAKKKK